MSSLVYTFSVLLSLAHGSQGGFESPRERAKHFRVADTTYRADLLRGMPWPRGLESWRW